MRNLTPKNLRIVAWAALLLGIAVGVVLAVPNSKLSDTGLTVNEPGSTWFMFAAAMGIFTWYSLLKEARERASLKPPAGDE
jgi:hypothetical protein